MAYNPADYHLKTVVDQALLRISNIAVDRVISIGGTSSSNGLYGRRRGMNSEIKLEISIEWCSYRDLNLRSKE